MTDASAPLAMSPLIDMQKITKSYRGVPAVREVDFDLRKGEIHALLGENGAGKSTLTKVMAGVVEATSGKMLYRGKEVSYASPFEALRDGIAMVFQETSLVPSMTVAQNLYLGDEKFLNRLRGVYIAAQQFLQSLNFSVDPTALVATLGAAKRQMVEIARAVHHKAEEYVRGDVYTNTVEGYYSIFKRGMKGVYQHCAEKHLHRYLSEFDFRYSNRSALGVNDGERRTLAIKGAAGKRLTYRGRH